MTEAEWLECQEPQSMLDVVLMHMTAERKLRLFAVACCRRSWRLIPRGRCRQAVEVAENYADGKCQVEELDAAARAARAACEARLPGVSARGGFAGYSTAGRSANDAAYHAVGYILGCAKNRNTESAAHVALLRDILGNPYRPMPAVARVWLDNRDGTVIRLAQGIYDDRAFERLPILADALEDAGCGDADILAHCRGPGPHVRGCWVVDLLLGKS